MSVTINKYVDIESGEPESPGGQVLADIEHAGNVQVARVGEAGNNAIAGVNNALAGAEQQLVVSADGQILRVVEEGDTQTARVIAEATQALEDAVVTDGASQAEAEAGALLTKVMAPLRVRQAIDVLSRNALITAAGVGAQDETIQTKFRRIVDMEGYLAFGHDPLVDDATYAMDAARNYLATLGGGVIRYSSPNWRMNWICAEQNISVVGAGGNAPYGLEGLRPFDKTKPVIEWGDGTNDIRNLSLINVHINGWDGTGGVSGWHEATRNAPAALRIRGGVISFYVDPTCSIYGGVHGVSVVPSLTMPVTVGEIGCDIRNDITGSTDARAIYITRTGVGLSGGYYTAVEWTGKVNCIQSNPFGDGGFLGEALELDGDQILFSVSGARAYWDIVAGHGIFINGSSYISCRGLNLDPGVLGGVVIRHSDPTMVDPTRFMTGWLQQGGQEWENGAGAKFTFPDEMGPVMYRPYMREMYVRYPQYISDPVNVFDQSIYWDLSGDKSEFFLHGSNLRADGSVVIRGGNAVSAGSITSASGSGGLYFVAAGAAADANLRFLPKGAGYSLFEGGGIQPIANNTQVNGGVGNAWANVVSIKYSDGAGLQVVGARQAAIADPTGGAVVDAEARATLVAILAILRPTGHGLIQP